jgi:hypothetical protein
MRDKTVYLQRAHIWAERSPTKLHPNKINIHIALDDKLISTVNNISGKRCHPHLFSKLQTILQAKGMWPVL